MEREIALKDRQEFVNMFEKANSVLKKTYLSNLDSYFLDRVQDESVPISQLADRLNSSVRFFELERIVINKNETLKG